MTCGMLRKPNIDFSEIDSRYTGIRRVAAVVTSCTCLKQLGPAKQYAVLAMKRIGADHDDPLWESINAVVQSHKRYLVNHGA